MQIGPVTLEGRQVRLEPVSLAHVPALWRVGAPEEIWRYIPYAIHSEDEMRSYVASELAKQQAGLVVRFTTIATAIAEPVGSTSYLNIDRQHRRLEIGGTWITPAWQRSPINTEAKYLQLRHAFETLGLHPGGVQDRRTEYEVTPGTRAHRGRRGGDVSQPYGDARWAHSSQRLFQYHERRLAGREDPSGRAHGRLYAFSLRERDRGEVARRLPWV